MIACQGETSLVSLGGECSQSGALDSFLLQSLEGSLVRRQSHLSDWSHCCEDVVLLPCTRVATRLARIWKQQRTYASNLRTIARTADFRHHERRILGIPSQMVSIERLILAYTRVSAGIATIKS